MEKNTFRLLLLCAVLVLALPLAVGKVKYPKTAKCPIDDVAAKATGKTRPTSDPECVSVQYRHKWTDYSNPLRPERSKHEFWVDICDDPANTSTPSR